MCWRVRGSGPQAQPVREALAAGGEVLIDAQLTPGAQSWGWMVMTGALPGRTGPTSVVEPVAPWLRWGTVRN